MTKIRCGSPMCMHNKGEFCDAEEIRLSDILTNKDGEQKHYHSCKAYEEDDEAIALREMVMDAIRGSFK